jgi:hypothetical protein
MTKVIQRIVLALAVVAAVAVALFVWAKSPYDQAEAVEVAKSFLAQLRADDFSNAHELTTKGGYVGKTPAELKTIAERQRCWAGRVDSTSPPQTNGNRLRRLVKRERMDLDEVRVEFVGPGACLLGVSLKKSAQNEWRVHYFATHAG